MRLKAKYGRKHYKSNDSYLNAVYKKNKALIDEYLADVGKEGGVSTLRQFKHNIFETLQTLKRKGETATITHAMNVFTSSAQFLKEDFYEIHFRENLMRGLKRFNALNTLFKLTNKKFDINQVEYIGDKSYRYRGYVLRFRNSPQTISIYKDEKDETSIAEIRNPRWNEYRVI